MDIEDFIQRYPQVFHMAEEGTWGRMQERGLLSTTALLDDFGYAGAERLPIESERRPKSVTITHKETGETAVIRDNLPLREQFLVPCLVDMTPRTFYELLNRKTFFWVSSERLERLLSARAYRNRPHDVLTVDTQSLVNRHGDDITLAPINTGATLYPSAPPRGADTFQPIQRYDYPAMVRWRGRKDAVVELAVDYAVPGIAELVVRVERRYRDEVQAVLWE